MRGQQVGHPAARDRIQRRRHGAKSVGQHQGEMVEAVAVERSCRDQMQRRLPQLQTAEHGMQVVPPQQRRRIAIVAHEQSQRCKRDRACEAKACQVQRGTAFTVIAPTYPRVERGTEKQSSQAEPRAGRQDGGDEQQPKPYRAARETGRPPHRNGCGCREEFGGPVGIAGGREDPPAAGFLDGPADEPGQRIHVRGLQARMTRHRQGRDGDGAEQEFEILSLAGDARLLRVQQRHEKDHEACRQACPAEAEVQRRVERTRCDRDERPRPQRDRGGGQPRA